MGIRILLADDHNLMREGVRSLIASQPDMCVVGEATEGKAAVRLAAKLSPDVILMDVAMPVLNGIEATRRILQARNAPRVVALSMHLDRSAVVDMLAAGASGYLLKDCVFEEVVLAVRTALSEGMYLSPCVAALLAKELLQRSVCDGPSPLEGLPAGERNVLSLAAEGKDPWETAALLSLDVRDVRSRLRRIMLDRAVPYFREAAEAARPGIWLDQREREILTWLREGKGTWEIASILGISEDTVKYHLKKSFRKLNATNRTQAIAVALDNKLIDA